MGFFESSRGLRQGDPLSSSLFVIVMEALSRLIHKRVDEDQNFTYHWRCAKTKITHLSFADDLMIFCGNSVHSIAVLNQALKDFSVLSGLHPNHQKSSIYVAGSDQAFKSAIQSTFGYQLGDLPVKYLGLPLITSRLSAADCKPLIDSINARIKSWIVRYLSFAGRLQLIQSVISSIQSFWSSLLILPKKVTKRVEQIIKNFL